MTAPRTKQHEQEEYIHQYIFGTYLISPASIANVPGGILVPNKINFASSILTDTYPKGLFLALKND